MHEGDGGGRRRGEPSAGGPPDRGERREGVTGHRCGIERARSADSAGWGLARDHGEEFNGESSGLTDICAAMRLTAYCEMVARRPTARGMSRSDRQIDEAE